METPGGNGETPVSPVGVIHTPAGQGLPDVIVVVNEGSTVGKDGMTYVGGDEVEVDAPTAMHLQSIGVATPKPVE